MLIGELARRSGVSTRMLRHYDRLGLVTPTGRTSGGYREYSDADVRRLFEVESLRTLGLTLPEVGAALDEAAYEPMQVVEDLIDRTRDRIAAEQELLARLQRVAATAPTQWADVLDAVAMLRALQSPSGAQRIRAALSGDDTRPPVAELAKAALAEHDPNVFGALRWSLARAGDAALDHLADGLAATDPRVRLRAVEAVTAIDSERTAMILLPVLADADDDVRDRAATALAARGSAESIDPLVSMIVAGRRDVEAAEYLGALAERGGSGRVLAGLRPHLDAADPAVRLRIVQALAEIPGVDGQRLLEEMTADVDPTVAATATAVLRARDVGARVIGR
ncbi:MerR family transcriptional regulator [Gordonia polyisoprenivorans]|uniref:MerR family transcriptional regulator n=1 Tax=Gordonia polyisoprenivorans TaxID=84595 RepID=UPI000B99E8DD|nr:MerR family transcriptional regulator [Gordonia polyisoprenivorans]OZC32965.1 MerR family transcriptional regulator [Gordonia polyisoprenivorans]UZF59257.1 MerR family transcriptional regulator [Gordonia polyisoprenivorans]